MYIKTCGLYQLISFRKGDKMHYGLGIDAGGTYTDAVIIRGSDGVIVDAKKAFTTYPGIQQGIKNVLDSLDSNYLKDVNLVSVSTTLSTNALLENTGRPVGLILVGEHPADKGYPADSVTFVSGGHDTNGEEEYPLDIEAVQRYVETSKPWVSAYAISAYFGTRNPKHELKVKSIMLYVIHGASVSTNFETETFKYFISNTFEIHDPRLSPTSNERRFAIRPGVPGLTCTALPDPRILPCRSHCITLLKGICAEILRC